MEIYRGDMGSQQAQVEFQQAIQSQQRRKMLSDIVQSLSRISFGKGNFGHESHCAICLCDYDEEDSITQLDCDPLRHFFHSRCLERNIQLGNDKCPFCRVPILASKKQAQE
jgi:hypothetical protein